MRTILSLAALAALASSAAFAQPVSAPDPRTWTSSVDAARYLPCDGWRQQPDGSWNWPGTMQIGGATMTNMTFGSHGQEAVVLNRRCAPAEKK